MINDPRWSLRDCHPPLCMANSVVTIMHSTRSRLPAWYCHWQCWWWVVVVVQAVWGPITRTWQCEQAGKWPLVVEDSEGGHCGRHWSQAIPGSGSLSVTLYTLTQLHPVPADNWNKVKLHKLKNWKYFTLFTYSDISLNILYQSLMFSKCWEQFDSDCIQASWDWSHDLSHSWYTMYTLYTAVHWHWGGHWQTGDTLPYFCILLFPISQKFDSHKKFST